MFFRKKAAQKDIETKIRDMQLYLENNYKDLAIQSRKEAIQMADQYYQEKKITQKQYDKYKKILDEYTQNMKNYNHQQFYHS